MSRQEANEQDNYYARTINRSSSSKNTVSTTSSDVSCNTSKKEVVKGYGTIESIGVDTNSGIVQQVEFNLNIYRQGDTYSGEIYIVNYDERRKINSNELTYFELSEEKCLCLFSVTSDDGHCKYNITITASPIVSARGDTAVLYAYAAPINNKGLNIGGPLSKGEITFCEKRRCGCK